MALDLVACLAPLAITAAATSSTASLDPATPEACLAGRWRRERVSERPCALDALQRVKDGLLIASQTFDGKHPPGDFRIELSRRGASVWHTETVSEGRVSAIDMALSLAASSVTASVTLAWLDVHPRPGRSRIRVAHGVPGSMKVLPALDLWRHSVHLGALHPSRNAVVYSSTAPGVDRFETAEAEFDRGRWRIQRVAGLDTRRLRFVRHLGKEHHLLTRFGPRHLWRAGDAWHSEQAGWRSDLNTFSLAADPHGPDLHLSYLRSSGELMYLRRRDALSSRPESGRDNYQWTKPEVVGCVRGKVSSTDLAVIDGTVTLAVWVVDMPHPLIMARRRPAGGWVCRRPWVPSVKTKALGNWHIRRRPQMALDASGELHVGFCDRSGVSYGRLSACPEVPKPVTPKPASSATVEAVLEDLERRSIWLHGKAGFRCKRTGFCSDMPLTGIWQFNRFCQRFLEIYDPASHPRPSWRNRGLMCDEAQSLCRLPPGRGLKVSRGLWPLEAVSYVGTGTAARVSAVFREAHATCESHGCGPFAEALRASACDIHDRLTHADGFEARKGSLTWMPNPLKGYGAYDPFRCWQRGDESTFCGHRDRGLSFRWRDGAPYLYEVKSHPHGACYQGPYRTFWPCEADK